MATNYMPDNARDRAIRDARQRLAAGDRPVFRVRFENVAQYRADPFGWFVWVLELPDVYATGSTPGDAVAAVTQSIAARIDLPRAAFEVIEDTSLSRRS